MKHFSPKCLHGSLIEEKSVTTDSGIPQKQWHCNRLDDYEEWYELPCTGSIPFHTQFQFQDIPVDKQEEL